MMPSIREIPLMNTVFIAVFAVIALLCLAALVYCVREKRFTDKLVAVNIITTLTLDIICMLAVYLMEDFVIDVALIYAVLGFLAVIVLTRQMYLRRQEKGGSGK